MNFLDRFIAFFNPKGAVLRAQARLALSYYEATRPDRLRKRNKEIGGPNTSNFTSVRPMRQQARFLDENHDLASGILDVLVANVVGPKGITIEPQPRNIDGTINYDFAGQILALHNEWQRRPEVTWQHDWPSAQRLLARSWFRDGEVFGQHLIGKVKGLDHGTAVPYSIEMLEADFVPVGMTLDNITQGVERNSWLRPTAFYVYKQHPDEFTMLYSLRNNDFKRVPAERMMHCKVVKRINQVRGISIFATIMLRLEDLKDYEESERIAAKVAASMSAYIKKGTPDIYDTNTDTTDKRELKFKPGMIFDDLQVGEEIGTIDTNRPNPQLEPHRKGQLRAVAAGARVSYSSAAKDYSGTYSAQRQELVESSGAYQILASEFTSRMIQPPYEAFVSAAIAAGKLQIPPELDLTTLLDALYTPPQMPWIDPLKEANAWKVLEDNHYASGPEIIRRRGQNPIDVIDQEKRWQQQLNERGLGQGIAPATDNTQTGGTNNAGTQMVRTTRRA